MTVEQIITGCINKNRGAQKELFYSYSKSLMATAFRYTRDEFAAKDVVQESFIKIYKSINQLKTHHEGTLISWMKKITARQALRYLEQRKSFQARQTTSRSHTVESTANMQMADVMKALEMLPEGYRNVFQLNVIEGYSHKEIGAMLQIEPSTSRSQLTRARSMFYEKWSELENYYGNVK